MPSPLATAHQPPGPWFRQHLALAKRVDLDFFCMVFPSRPMAPRETSASKPTKGQRQGQEPFGRSKLTIR